MNTSQFVRVLQVPLHVAAILAACAFIGGCGGGGSDGTSRPSTASLASAVSAQPKASAVRVDAEPAGTNCPEGGLSIAAGLDTDRNGVLDLAEIVSRQYICHGATGPAGSVGTNGAAGMPGPAGAAGTAGATGMAGIAGGSGSAGTTSLVRVDSEPAGASCPNGGYAISVGVDSNADGQLAIAEMSSVAYVCTGANGATGPTGAAGAAGTTGAAGSTGTAALVAMSPEPAGAHCNYAGTRIDSGLDNNGNGVLSAGETTSTTYICNGPPGPGVTWVDVSSTSFQAISNTGYLANNVAEVAITLPATPTVGDVFRINGIGTGGWKLVQNAGQWIGTSGLPGNAEPGSSWALRDAPRNWSSISMSGDGQRMVAGDYNGFLYTSSDSGAIWSSRDAQRRWISVASSSDGNRLIAAAQNDQLYVSADAGLTWQCVEAARNWLSVASSADGSKLAAVVYGGFIYVSNDYGLTWTATATSQQWRTVAISADGSRLFATGLYIAVYASADGGVTWTSSGTPSDMNDIAISSDGRQVVRTLWNDQIFVSADYGVTWTGRGVARQWYGLASSADGAQLIATEANGLSYISSDHGRNWRSSGPVRGFTRLASSSYGNILARAGGNNQLLISVGASSQTTVGSAGSLGGPQGGAVELQYVGGGRFNVLSHNQPRGGFTVR